MLSLLARFFIKNSKHYSDVKVRQQYGILCGALGIAFNMLLCAAKLTAGFLSRSMSIVADGFNHLSDAASSLATILGFKFAAKRPDSEHPFGHGRMEYIAGLIISFLICVIGLELLQSSVKGFFSKAEYEFSTLSFVVMGGSILVKLYMYCYNHFAGKKIKSVTLEAAAKDSLSDILSSAIVIAAMIFSRWTAFPLDAAAGLVVALFILKTGLNSAKDTVSPLLGMPPDPEFIHAIEEEIASFPEILGFHDLIVHNYGPGRFMVTVHAEVPGDKNVFEMHDVINSCEVSIAKKLGAEVVIHMDPVDRNNQRLNDLKLILFEELSKIDSTLKFHDLYLVPLSKTTKLIFELVKPFDSKWEDKALVKKIQSAVNKRAPDVKCVIKVEYPFA